MTKVYARVDEAGYSGDSILNYDGNNFNGLKSDPERLWIDD